MSLASLFNVPSEERPGSWSEWSFANMDQHRLIIDALLAQQNVALTLLPLDPIPSFDLGGWARRHQTMHNEMDAQLGIEGVDLTSVDLENPEEIVAWIRLHADEHRQAAQTLGIG